MNRIKINDYRISVNQTIGFEKTTDPSGGNTYRGAKSGVQYRNNSVLYLAFIIKYKIISILEKLVNLW